MAGKVHFTRDNLGKFRKRATVQMTKKLKEIAKTTQRNVQEDIREKLEETYKNNVAASFSPRSAKGLEVQAYNKKHKYTGSHKTLTYHHEDPSPLLEAISAQINGDLVEIVIDPTKTYKDGTSAADVHKWLKDGTKGGGNYTYTAYNGDTKWAYNYPTPAHLFEEHTRMQMKGYLESIKSDIKKGKYSKKRR